TATVPPPSPGARPIAIDERPLTIGKGQAEVHGAPFPITVLPFLDNMGATTTSTFVGFAIGASYGIDDKLEIGGDYGFGLSPGDIKGPLVLHGAYTLKVSPKLSAAIAGAFVVHPVTVNDPATGMALPSTTYAALQLGAWVRYHVAPKISIFTGLP